MPTPICSEPIRVGSLTLPPLLILGAAFMGADFTAVTLNPLRALGIPYPPVMDYACWLVAGGCIGLWLATLWKWPRAGSIAAVTLCLLLVRELPRYGEHRIVRIPVRQWIETDRFAADLKFPVTETGSATGTFVVVAPQNERATRDRLRQLGPLAAASSGGT